MAKELQTLNVIDQAGNLPPRISVTVGTIPPTATAEIVKNSQNRSGLKKEKNRPIAATKSIAMRPALSESLSLAEGEMYLL